MTHTFPIERITSKILLIRNQNVILDADLATLYGVATKMLNQAVKRNEKRFPSDFMFRLTKEEKEELVTNCDRLKKLKHSTSMPRAFTEQGVAMLSSVLNSDRAIAVNIQIMRAFTQLRQMLLTNKDLKKKIESMEKKYDEQFTQLNSLRCLCIILMFCIVKKMETFTPVLRKISS
jgi:hypothetical protein